ncbi:uncharacterized protein LOC119305062 [Triticum dicoccoides]|uniref:uncharacterized protein LOC119305062 n=1 Tax=Triticum dicoccoides TaxID=85692 RepID=UPI00188F55F6|nr:uncharacterized protein LOC119305062 [Triticum dicoccoides]
MEDGDEPQPSRQHRDPTPALGAWARHMGVLAAAVDLDDGDICSISLPSGCRPTTNPSLAVSIGIQPLLSVLGQGIWGCLLPRWTSTPATSAASPSRRAAGPVRPRDWPRTTAIRHGRVARYRGKGSRIGM